MRDWEERMHKWVIKKIKEKGLLEKSVKINLRENRRRKRRQEKEKRDNRKLTQEKKREKKRI